MDMPISRANQGEVPRIFHQVPGLGDLNCAVVGNLSLAPVYTCAYNKFI
jgi:hypothetical protein